MPQSKEYCSNVDAGEKAFYAFKGVDANYILVMEDLGLK